MEVRSTTSVSDVLPIQRYGNSLILRVSALARALEVEQGDSVRVTLEIENGD